MDQDFLDIAVSELPQQWRLEGRGEGGREKLTHGEIFPSEQMAIYIYNTVLHMMHKCQFFILSEGGGDIKIFVFAPITGPF